MVSVSGLVELLFAIFMPGEAVLMRWIPALYSDDYTILISGVQIVHLYINFVFFTMVFCITPGCCLVYQSTNACSLSLEFPMSPVRTGTQLLVTLR